MSKKISFDNEAKFPFPPSLMEEFQNSVSWDVLRMVLGQKIGEGIGRQVFVCNYDWALVVKLEDRERSFQNIHEWEFGGMYTRPRRSPSGSHPATTSA